MTVSNRLNTAQNNQLKACILDKIMIKCMDGWMDISMVVRNLVVVEEWLECLHTMNSERVLTDWLGIVEIVVKEC